MPKIEVDQKAYEHVLSELENIQKILYENIDDLDDVENDLLTLQSGRAVEAQAIKIQETKSDLENFTNSEVANMIEIIEDLIEVIQKNLNPEYSNGKILLDTDKIKEALKDSISTFSKNSYKLKTVIENSETFENVMKSRHQELDDNFSEALFNPIDEARQSKAENIFRSNEAIMKNINVYLAEELTFKNELDAIEDLIRTFDTLEDKFDPILDKLCRASLYDSFMSKTMGVNFASKAIDMHTPKEDSFIKNVIKDVTNIDLINIIIANINYEFYYEVMFGGAIKIGKEEWAELFLKSGGFTTERILKCVDPFNLVDLVFLIIHVIEYATGKITGYEFGKQIAGDIGSAFGGGALEAILGLLSLEIGVIPGVIVGNVVGSLGGEIFMENLYEEIFIEDLDGSIYWIWEE